MTNQEPNRRNYHFRIYDAIIPGDPTGKVKMARKQRKFKKSGELKGIKAPNNKGQGQPKRSGYAYYDDGPFVEERNIPHPYKPTDKVTNDPHIR